MTAHDDETDREFGIRVLERLGVRTCEPAAPMGSVRDFTPIAAHDDHYILTRAIFVAEYEPRTSNDIETPRREPTRRFASDRMRP
ncbi:MAG: hypothetical protein JWP01_3371 [Myxococcales bacterium]|nr:hypothetical protein [Myxococcales bacterium]